MSLTLLTLKMKIIPCYLKLALAFCIYLLFSANSFCIQNNPISAGKSAAMSNVTIGINNIWSIYHNQAGLGYLKNSTVGAFHQSGFVKEQNLQGIACALSTKTGTIGASYSYYGYSNYNEMQAGLAFGRQFNKYFSAGIQINYLHTHIISNYGNASAVNFEVGILSEPVDNFFIGAHVYNPSRSKLGDENIPTIFNVGVSYLFSAKALLAIGTEKELDQEAIFKIGLDYRLIDYVSLQAGASTNPNNYSFGIGFHHKTINAHVGFLKHQTLGFKPSFTLSYGF